ncbi:hypothetical protein EYF80_029683 [Liparis tanakae]|uniref:Uncharacterized protein n=1 Tax=Liparis tanakae TaxID=230148 RepID=A0A4Z2H3D8_9TELE|nr:hypothetical protein EYF80_029683 [Liparis tanakae]
MATADREDKPRTWRKTALMRGEERLGAARLHLVPITSDSCEVTEGGMVPIREQTEDNRGLGARPEQDGTGCLQSQ